MNLYASDIEKILLWYEKERRDLPWRRDKDPYHIWISEIMLQQTRIETVIPYYERFLRELPDIASLASVDDEKLMKLWEGLGYYSRAKNLKKAAQVIMDRYDGIFPDDPQDILSLPGIGPYTCGAIASIAFNKKTPAIDGNVLRVFARYLREERSVDDASYKKELYQLLKERYPDDAGAFTSALMEIGERVCLPNTAPLCEKCPMKEHCLSHMEHCEEEYPHMPEKKKAKVEKQTVFILISDGYTALHKRNDTGLLAGLYEFPNVPSHLSEEETRELWKDLDILSIEQSEDYIHRFSHIHWDNKVYKVSCRKKNEDLLWIKISDLKDVPLPTAFRKCRDCLI